ncbi:MAG: (d)CMP kinase [Synergistaceae bacterium]|nr:(d)CMP kinase [Synergistaceae bacterium]
MSYVITIDGPAGAGKSSIAKRAAHELGIQYLDTGAIYRAIGVILNAAEVKPDNEEILREALGKIRVELRNGRVFVNDFDVSGEIRTPTADEMSSVYSALPAVREALLGLQQEQPKHGSIIAEGRDVGSVVFPDALVKFYMTASPQARAKRRYSERVSKGKSANYDDILAAIIERDKHDSTRETAPLTIPEGAIFLDTSDMTEDEVLDRVLHEVRKALS